MVGSTAAAATREVRVFISDFPGKPPVLSVETSMTVSQLKARIIAAWPISSSSSSSADVPTKGDHIRLVVMGRALEDGTLTQLPNYSFPVPVHVMVRAGSKKAAGASRPAVPSPTKAAATPGQAEGQTQAAACCVVM
jgi:hypothetical protein